MKSENIPSPTPVIPKIKPIFAVWNGSGVSGSAGMLAAKLEAVGLDVAETKNAPAQVEGSQVEVIAELAAQRSLIEAELTKLGVKVARWSAELSDEHGYNIRITIGK